MDGKAQISVWVQTLTWAKEAAEGAVEDGIKQEPGKGASMELSSKLLRNMSTSSKSLVGIELGKSSTGDCSVETQSAIWLQVLELLEVLWACLRCLVRYSLRLNSFSHKLHLCTLCICAVSICLLRLHL